MYKVLDSVLSAHPKPFHDAFDHFLESILCLNFVYFHFFETESYVARVGLEITTHIGMRSESPVFTSGVLRL